MIVFFFFFFLLSHLIFIPCQILSYIYVTSSSFFSLFFFLYIYINHSRNELEDFKKLFNDVEKSKIILADKLRESETGKVLTEKDLQEERDAVVRRLENQMRNSEGACVVLQCVAVSYQYFLSRYIIKHVYIDNILTNEYRNFFAIELFFFELLFLFVLIFFCFF